MTRKRSISSVLEDDSRPIAKPIRSSTRTKVNCFCDKCEGKLVDPRTQRKHASSSSQMSIQEDIEAESSQQNTNNELYQSARFSRQQIEVSQDTVDIEDIEEENQETDDSDFNYLPREHVSRYTKLSTTFTELFINDFEQSEATESDTGIDDNDDSANNEYSEIFENYSCPPFEPSINTEVVNDNRILWILIWIMRFQTRFNLPETGIESLIKFMKLVLREIGGSNFDTFPGTLFLAKNVLGLKDLFHSFVPCQKCHKLYNKQELENFYQDEDLTVTKCQHIEFPNSTSRRLKRCQTPLYDQILLTNEKLSLKPKLIYPFAGICMENMDDWFITRNSNEHRQNALGWRRCNSDASRNRFAKQTGVRWSELLRLPYFDPIMFTIVDPMHCLFLGIARWIVKRLWIEMSVLSQETLKIIQKKMNEFQIPSDLG
ncbi:hypothetical protein RhiirA1_396016 [Rhizophagus irregularis]|uniref:Transposase domain-containing protein n=1 Tax=Rhizophagus irregularis TaxID=588596 RepID=A0A2N0RMD9_9GLOM|nr:hypothetical protein RhiirA1_396016 [Rhizophagus irregularis]